MNPLVLPGFILLIIIIIFIAAIPVFRAKQAAIKKTGKYPEGYFLSVGIAVGMGIGTAIGLALDNIALGPAMGLPIGVAVGMGMEEKNKDKLRPLTVEEKKAKQKTLTWLLVLGIVLLILFTITFFIDF